MATHAEAMSRRLNILASEDEKFALIAERLRAASGGRRLEILEAGCGRWWPFARLDIPYRLTGIDIDADALAFRKNSLGDLHETIVGDLRDVALPEESFDAIYSNCVLEHVRGSARVLANFSRWLKPGGLLVVCVPDVRSVYGFVARFTPHPFHIFYYKHFRGHCLAGEPGHGPYKAYYEHAVSEAGLNAFAAVHGLGVEAVYGVKNPPTAEHAALFRLASILSFGFLRPHHSDLLFLFRKPESTASSSAIAAEGARSFAPLIT
jgi:SAM-dependent methyltransferase